MSERKFEWDAEKADANFRKHRVSFDEAKTAFDDPNARARYDAGHSEVEDRWQLIGLSGRLRLLIVIYAKGNEATFRLISARRATRAEEGGYAVED